MSNISIDWKKIPVGSVGLGDRMLKKESLVTNWAQILRLKKWDQSDTWITGILWIFAEKMFFQFSWTFFDQSKNREYFWNADWLQFILDPLNVFKIFF